MKCRYCGHENDSDALYCEGCGRSLRKKTGLITGAAAGGAIILIIAILLIVKPGGDDEMSYDDTYSDGHCSEDYEEDVSYGPPRFESARASSTLDPMDNGTSTYYPEHAMDGDMHTAWVEGAAGNGIGESITFDSFDTQLVSGFAIYNGYCKNRKVYDKNARVREIAIVFDDGSEETFILDDDYFTEQDLQLDSPVETTSVTFVIRSVYEGGSCTDTCITDISAY